VASRVGRKTEGSGKLKKTSVTTRGRGVVTEVLGKKMNDQRATKYNRRQRRKKIAAKTTATTSGQSKRTQRPAGFTTRGGENGEKKISTFLVRVVGTLVTK